MAEIKITELPELDATPDGADISEIVDDVIGTPTSKKITMANLRGGMAPLNSPAFIGVATIEDLTFSKTLKTHQGIPVVSANDMTLGDGNLFDITGNTTINTIVSKGIGTKITLQFDATLQLTHSNDLLLPTEANINTAAGDIVVFYEYASGDWRCSSYTRADGRSLVDVGGDVSTDVIWAAAGDLVKGTGDDTADILSKGTALALLRMNAGGTTMEWGTAGQIAFPDTAVPSGDPNTLDDYEEGTWTPTGTLVTAGNSSNANQGGTYQIVGNQITVVGTTNFTKGTGSGNFTITGMPVAEGASMVVVVNVLIIGAGAANHTIVSQIGVAGQVIVIYLQPEGTEDPNQITDAALDTTISCRVAVTYRF